MGGITTSSFKPGYSGNPGGRPKALVQVRELAREYTEEAIQKLVELMRKADSDQAQILAANSLLDRDWGRPVQTLGGDPEGMPIIHEHRAVVLAEIHRIIAAHQPDGGDGGDEREADGGAPLRLEWSEGTGIPPTGEWRTWLQAAVNAR